MTQTHSAPPPRAVAIDIDGTLVNSAKQITPFTRREIARVAATGAHIVIVTARSLEASRIIEAKLGTPTSHIAFGGGSIRVRHEDRLESVHDLAFTPDETRTVLAAARDTRVHIGVYTDTEWQVSDLGIPGLREARNTSIWPARIDPDIAHHPPEASVYKLMFRGDPGELAPIAAAIKSSLPDVFAHHTGRILEVTRSRKHLALAQFAQHVGIPLDAFIAFGDTSADVPMLEQVGIGVLMGNADPELAVAEHVTRTLTNDEDGVGLSLRAHFPTSGPFEI